MVERVNQISFSRRVVKSEKSRDVVRKIKSHKQVETTTKKRRCKLNEGDIFTIPVDDHTQGFGQIIKIPRKHTFIMVVFEGRWSVNEITQLDIIIKSPILLLGYSQDALLYHGRWLIIGNETSNLSSIKLPFYKLGLLPSVSLLDYAGNIMRAALPAEADLLNWQHDMSPLGYQKELQAYYCATEWERDLKYHYKDMVGILNKLGLL